MKKIFIIICILMFSVPAFAETIHLDSGKIVEGNIVERTDDYIKIDAGGVSVTYYLDEIVSIDSQDSEDANANASDEEDLGFGQFSYTDPSKSFIWEVKSETTTAYILGSIHAADESFYPLPVAIEKSFQKADVLAVEVDVLNADQDEMKAQFNEKGMYKGGQTLKDEISEETFTMLKEYLDQYEVDVTPFLLLKPWLVSLTIVQIEMARLGFNPNFGIDMHFLRLAINRKKIVELEDMEMQTDLMANLFGQDIFLQHTLFDMASQEKILKKLVRFWKTGNAEKINNLMVEEPLEENPEYEEFYEEFFFERNDEMTEKIKGYLQSEDVYFVVVGAGHLVGDRGIIKQLKKSGYTPKQL